MKRLHIVVLLILLTGCADPLPEKDKAFAGLWASNQTSLLITEAGRMEYKSNKGSAKTTLSMPIKSISESELVAGFLFINSRFELKGKPQLVDGYTVLNIDGEDLYKIGSDGKVIFSLDVPPLTGIRELANQELESLAAAFKGNDFSTYLKTASMQYQSQYDNEKLLKAFSPFLENNINLRKWMSGDFILTDEPVIDENGVLKFSGKYPTSPESLKFSGSYVFSEGIWKTLGPNIQINGE